jgi:GntR family transcriptional repressor for pyruvate dehydrogenase complex
MSTEIFQSLSEIKVEKLSDKIIEQIKNLISSGQLKPGDRLPSERKLSETFNVGRMHVRDAIQKLEFYGIVKTLPQSGTVVEGLGVVALEGIITDILELTDADFQSMTETRIILEANAAELAARRATKSDLVKIEESIHAFEEKVKKGIPGIEEDLMFHLKIAESTHNPVLNSLMLLILPDVIRFNKNLQICSDGRFIEAFEEHEIIYDHIKNGRGKEAAESMSYHLRDLIVNDIPPKYQ